MDSEKRTSFEWICYNQGSKKKNALWACLLSFFLFFLPSFLPCFLPPFLILPVNFHRARVCFIHHWLSEVTKSCCRCLYLAPTPASCLSCSSCFCRWPQPCEGPGSSYCTSAVVVKWPQNACDQSKNSCVSVRTTLNKLQSFLFLTF